VQVVEKTDERMMTEMKRNGTKKIMTVVSFFICFLFSSSFHEIEK
jgi:hypothetical protein